MKIDTRKFGEIEIDETKILTMPDGLLGFPGFERFALLEDPKTVPFCWFQSLEESNLALVVMNPFLFMQDYKLDLDGFVAAKGWKGVKAEELQIYVVVNISQGEEGKKVTANLQGPLVININNNEAFQVVIPDSVYSYQHNILEAS
ncbi:MAG: flagellar assembly protein FliW [Desulfobacteraceae bacterium]|nr:flagellar assembly protein FliW [Desulfobacteraceae bacterium]